MRWVLAGLVVALAACGGRMNLAGTGGAPAAPDSPGGSEGGGRTASGSLGGAGASGSATPASSVGSGGGKAQPNDAAYPYCKWEGPGGYEKYCAPTYTGWGHYNWHVEGDGSSFCGGGPDSPKCNACACRVACGLVQGKDGKGGGEPSWADCPAPATGTAQPECLHMNSKNGECWLTCDHGELCPVGMSCVDNLEFSRQLCAWVTE
ncbi:MAG: hypothetical protein HY744_02105 [Deltaproteobacteria bacterium]|nr:hypothetical protein [Deltaproteobacteria bacterium]